ncbi:chorismate mutase [Streptococcus parasuis]|uniref:chorismate mutase n=1 Tax=Streptococcus parasuis TaxID=1501662 RepID=UPI001C2B8652|nr:chorismate mutase [Streptococcus parasuis]MDG3145439.1 chorismate mutase [Streptococcus suis]MBV1943654.1 chorismate mutase [Streptococcus parasuis]MDG3181421.1 chorismate mutase [Streptococcus suis]QXF06065.1 chorismate mutase [Streptococcus parasuis]WDM38110.1 chorismate mutase [Streptococcus parasuis]
MDLDMIRSQINQLDEELVALLEKRMELVDQVAAYKRATGKPVLDTIREKAVLERVGKLVQKDDYRSAIQATFSDMIAQSRAYQSSKLANHE